MSILRDIVIRLNMADSVIDSETASELDVSSEHSTSESAHSIEFEVPQTNLPVWINPGENLLAARHRRSPLGFVMLPGCILRYRLNPVYETARTVTLRLLNDNRNTETELQIENDCWEYVTHQTPCVPFVDNIQFRENVGVQFELSGPHVKLPIYVHNETDVESFKREYELSDSQFAFLNLNLAVILVPPANKSDILSLDLSKLYQFYNEIINYYDSLIGLTHLPYFKSSDNDFNKQLFVKADSSGIGAAYYGPLWTAHNSNALHEYIQVSDTNWLVLHELAHAYDFVFTNFSTRLIEVWNNILCDRMQYQWMSKERRRTHARIYEGEQEHYEADIQKLIDDNIQYNEWDLFEKLMLFVWLMNTRNGPTMFMRINQSFRYQKVARLVHPQIWAWLLLNSVDNIGLVFKLFNIDSAMYYLHRSDILPVNYHERCVNAYNKIQYPIKFLISDFDVKSNNYNIKQYVESNFDMVTPELLKQTGLLIETVIECQIDDISQIVGDLFYIYDGNELVYRNVVTEDAKITAILAPGVYTVHAPRGRNKRYTLQFEGFKGPYLKIQVPTVNEKLVYTPLKTSIIEKEIGHVFGWQSLYLATFYLDIAGRELTFHLNNNQPSTGEPEMYFEMSIQKGDESPHTTFTVNGNSAHLRTGWYSFEIVPGDRLVLRQRRANIIHFLDVYVQVLSSTYIITEHDVQSLSFENHPSKLQRLLNRMSTQADFLDSHTNLLFIENELRDSIFASSKHFAPDNNDLVQRFFKYFPDYYRENGGLYRFQFLGIGHRVCMEFECNLLTNQSTTRVFAQNLGPHSYFDTEYIGVEVFDDKGVSVSRVYLLGDVPTENQDFNFFIGHRYSVQLFHREPDRLLLYKKGTLTAETFSRDTNMTVSYTQFIIS